MEKESQITNEETFERSEKELLTELVKSSKKQLFYQRVRTLIMFITAAVIITSLVVLVSVVSNTTSRAEEIMVEASQTLSFANEAMESITEMSVEITEMSENMDTFLEDNAETVAAVMEKMESVDFEGLNSAIEDLGAVVEPLANFFKKF